MTSAPMILEEMLDWALQAAGEKKTEKGADIADIVTPGGQASQRHDIKVVTECRTSDGKLTNCGNMPQVEKVSPPDKNGRCHDDQGHLASCNGGGGKGTTANEPAPRRNSDLPPWMQEKPKPKAPEAAPKPPASDTSHNTMRYGKMPNGPHNTWVPDKNGKFPYPDTPHARLDLKPLVGKKVKVTYWTEKMGGPSFTDRNVLSRCIKDVQVEGVEQPFDHMWEQAPSKKILGAKIGQKQSGIGLVTAYDKGKPGQPRRMDYSVQFIEDIEDKALKMVRDENGRCHDDQGHLTSCGDASAEPSGDKPGAPKDQPAPGKTPTKPAEGESQETRHDPEKPKLEAHVRQSLGDYTTAEHAFVNAYLRFPPKDGKVPKQYAEMTRNLDEAMEKTGGLKGEEIVYRGINYKAAFGKTPVESLKGAIIQDPGFVSTSLDREKAKQFGDAVFTLRVPKGTKAVRMQDYIHTTTTEAEKEILLHRGVKYQITHIREEKGGFLGLGKKIYIDARVIE